MNERLHSFFDELTKIGNVTNAVVKNVLTNPVKYYAAQQRMEKGKKLHHQMMEAYERNTPASWAALGMRVE
jgi:hypothetical protein